MAEQGDVFEWSDDEEQLPAPRRVGRAAGANRVPLHQFLRLIAGGRMVDHGAANSNEDLIKTLQRAGVIQSESVCMAMRLCSRDLFVPEEYREDAFMDAPIRVEEHDFNISAPHMHATCLEALALKPGHKVLDVGSGCGVIAACAAYIVGQQGAVVGIDVREACIQQSRGNVHNLAAVNKEYSSGACASHFELHNCFMPSPKHVAMYDRVHVGASCPPDGLQSLLRLLKPEGGLIVVPVSPSDLRIITKRPNGSIAQKVISQVRFSDLDVPTDAEVLLATLKLERKQHTAAAYVPSTYMKDLTGVLGSASLACAMSSSPAGVIDGFPSTPSAQGRSWPHRFARLISGCSVPRGDSLSGEDSPREAMVLDGDGASFLAASPSFNLDFEQLGEPDCMLMGPGWEIPAHRAMLQARCEHFRARCKSGMRDAVAAAIVVPDHFGREAIEALLHYVYHDSTDRSVEPEVVVSVLHAAQYYGIPRLAHLCEVTLAKMLRGKGAPADGIADCSAALLALADDHGLPHLLCVALDFCVANFEEVSKTESYAALSRDQVNLVAAEAARLYRRSVMAVHEMHDAAQSSLPEPTY